MSLTDAERPLAGHPLIKPLAACRDHLVYAGGLSALINLLYLAPTLYMLQVYDRVVPTRGGATLLFLTFLLLASLATLALLEMMRSRLLVRASARLERTFASAILTQMLSHRSAANPPQAMREFDILRQTMSGAGVLALFDAPWTVVYIALCFLIHPLLGALAIVGSASLIALTVATERATRSRVDAANTAASWFYTSQAQSLAAADVVGALGMADAMVSRHAQERSTITRLQAEASLAAGKFLSLTKFLRLALQSLALGLAAYLAIGQAISAGAIFAASLLIARALMPIEQVLGSWKSLAEAHHAYGSLKALMSGRAAASPRTLLPPPSGRVSVDQVTVLAGAGQRPLLLGVNMAVEPGEVLGLVGASGAGKTTLMRTIVGALAPSQGQVRLDGADIADWDPNRLGRHVGYLPQDVSLFQGTVKQNICRFRDCLGEDPGHIDAMAVAAAKACGAHEMILRLAQGYDTVLGWGGQGVSLGQAQKIAIARALFGEPSLVALDEPNAHLDEEGEAMLLAALAQLKARGASVIVVAHRASLLEAMTDLLVLAQGRVVQRGPRDAVLGRLRAPPHAVIQVNPGLKYA
jgi:ATP-binding cassette subfamily C protein